MARGHQVQAGQGEIERQVRLFPEATPATGQAARWRSWSQKDLTCGYRSLHLGQLPSPLGDTEPAPFLVLKGSSSTQTVSLGAESWGAALFLLFQLEPCPRLSTGGPSGLDSAAPLKVLDCLKRKKQVSRGPTC